MSNLRNEPNKAFEVMFTEGSDNNNFLEKHFDDSFPHEGCAEKPPKWYEEMTTSDARQIK